MSIHNYFGATPAHKSGATPADATDEKEVVNLHIPVNPYYVDTITKYGEELPVGAPAASIRANQSLSSVQTSVSQELDKRLAEANHNYEKIQALFFSSLVLNSRERNKFTQDYIRETSEKMKSKALQIKGTYDNLLVHGLQVVGGVVSIALGTIPFGGSAFGKIISANQQVAGAIPTGLSSFTSIFSSHTEGNRSLYQSESKTLQDQEENQKNTKHRESEAQKTAKDAQNEHQRNLHDLARTITS